MDTLGTLWAELHREELLREAAARRRARPASYPDATTNVTGSGLIDRLRSVLGPVGRPVQPDCTECA
jgi:hypothetical protein